MSSLSFRSSAIVRSAVLFTATLPFSVRALASDCALTETLKADYPLTKVGISILTSTTIASPSQGLY
jgi:hypothetical protein